MNNEFVKDLFTEALEVSEAMEDFIEALDENREAFSAYDDFWADATQLFEEWGVEDSIELLGALCSVPRTDAQEGLAGLAEDFAIVDILKEDEELREDLFLAIQLYVKNYHIDIDNCTRPQKETMSQVAKMLATAFETFGYGLCENGLVVVMWAFNHGAIEGLNTDWYTDDSEYDAQELGYYDGIENEKIFDDFFAQNNIQELLK